MNQNLLKLGRQLRELWNQLGLNQRISVGLAAAAVLAGVISLAWWSNQKDYALLYGRLDEAEASKITAVLDETKTPYQLGRNGASILVPADKVHSVRMQLASRGLPNGEGVGFEIFDKPNFGISDFVQRANYLRAVQGELARTISQLDQLEGARVMVVMPENRLLTDSSKKPTASVFVRVKGNAQLAPSAVNSITFLVANAVEGLQANNVTVVDNRGNVLTENHQPDSAAGLSFTQLNARRNLEQYLGKKAESMLEKVLGPGQAVVRVAADINWDSTTRTEETFQPDGQVARSETITDENTDSTTLSSSTSAVGVSSNITGETNRVSAVPGTNSRVKKKVTNNEYEISKTTSNIMQSAGSVKRISAAVFVASRLEGTGPQRKPAPRSPEEVQKLKRIVASALGLQENGAPSRNDEITLEEMPFNDQPFAELTTDLQTQEHRDFWFGLVKKAIYPALALGVLFGFWRALQKTPPLDIPIGVPLSQFNGHSNGHGNGNGNGNGHGKSSGRHNGWHKEPATGVVTVDVLNQLIRENPENMTQAVQNWLGRVKPEK